ncbi:MAG: molybdopterin molybdotransferase MoeA [Hyphomicrobiales bacterium]|nr:molybdopterin molybdotransferase MoeA [Hyphomicrobiales bacterium]OQW82146.1 MAG: hypothetical protein BVN31_09280 [Proteobacteria bacterium ST_bin15]
MLSVEEARRRILSGVNRLPAEITPIEDAQGRVLADPLLARLSQPPFASAAMDGYAIRAMDAAQDVSFRVIGQSAAGTPFAGCLGERQAVRIFTGAIVPADADKVIPQEFASREGDDVRFAALPSSPFVRALGLDFGLGDVILEAGHQLDAAAIGLAAAANHRQLSLVRRPRIAILATGDEIIPPGAIRSDGQIHSSSLYAVRAACLAAGAEVINLGIARDERALLAQRFTAAIAIPADVMITLGGASVGDHDLVQETFARAGGELGFWRISMRPGKPLIFGTAGSLRLLGLPGNPVSSYVCCWLFVLPLIRALLGLASEPKLCLARLGADLAANDEREDYLRARLVSDPHGTITATAFSRQDSSLQSVLASANGLILRPPHAPAARAGEICTVLPLYT